MKIKFFDWSKIKKTLNKFGKYLPVLIFISIIIFFISLFKKWTPMPFLLFYSFFFSVLYIFASFISYYCFTCRDEIENN